MGDFNLNLLNSESHAPTGEFLDTMLSKMLFPLISKPSRITANTASLIDNIFTNDYAQIKCGLLFTDISDHFPVFSLSKSTSTSDSSENESNFIRNFKTANRTKFDAMLHNKDWTELYSLGDPNDAYNAFSKSFIEIYNNCFPLEKPSRRVSTSLRKPWISTALLKSINTKNKLYRRFLKKPTPKHNNKYKTYKNRLNHLLRIAKHN